MLNMKRNETHMQKYDRRSRRVQRLAYGISAAIWMALLIPLVLWWNENSRANWMLIALGCASLFAPFVLGAFLENLLQLALDAWSGIGRTPQGMPVYKASLIDAEESSLADQDSSMKSQALHSFKDGRSHRSKTNRSPDIAA